MVIVPLHRHFSPQHLDEVAHAMLRLGAPRIRAFYDASFGCWLAREGTHRLRAAFALGVAPVMIPIAWWRSGAALARARFAAMEYGYDFPGVNVEPFGIS